MHTPWDITLGRLKVAMINFVVVAAIGSLLRASFLYPIPGLVYSYTLHAHSHMAFLGWVFMALYSLLAFAFLPEEKFSTSKYKWFFLLFQGANLGMLFTFPFTGYALWSIIFSSVHAVGAMVFAVVFLKDATPGLDNRYKMAFGFAKWGLILMILSNFGPFALGAVMAQGGGKTDLYYLLVYFYLHFQYNGWFTFALIGLLLWQLEQAGIATNHSSVRWALRLKVMAIFPAYILSTLWLKPDTAWYWAGGIAALLQLIGAGIIILLLLRNKSVVLRQKSGIMKLFFFGMVLAIFLQHALQFLSALPWLAELAFARNIVIAYLHLVLIGFVTLGLLFLIRTNGFSRESTGLSVAQSIFLAGFAATEFILLFMGQVTKPALWLLALALVQLGGVVWMAWGMKKSSFAILLR